MTGMGEADVETGLTLYPTWKPIYAAKGYFNAI
jgi:hypothetical protein